MPIVTVGASLPKGLLQGLRKCNDVVFRENCEIPIVELVESEAGTDMFLEFLKDEHKDDPWLFPNFGHPLYPYIPPNIQVEVYNLLTTYQPLVAASFHPGAAQFPFIVANLPILGGGVQYHHAKIAIHALYMEIQQISTFAANCPGIASLVSGQIICDLNIMYANAVVVIRLRKF